MEIGQCVPIRPKPPPKIITKSVKQCLGAESITTRFQSLMNDIRQNIILKNTKTTEIGKSIVKVSTLPGHIDPIWTTFGDSRKDPCTTSDIIHGEYIWYLDDSIKRPEDPGEQITRRYEKPFNKRATFGKKSKADIEGRKAKKLVHWFVPPESQSKYYTTTYQETLTPPKT